MSRTLALTLVAAAALYGYSDSFAFQMIQNAAVGRVTAGFIVPCNDVGGFVHWTNSPNIDWRHNAALQGSGKAAALQAAMTSWSGVTGASHVVTYAGTTTAGWATDGVNTALWAVGNGCTGTGPGSCLALTALVLQSGQVIVETDITFNNEQTWTTNGSDFDTEAVAAHELGHTLGLHHTDVTANQPTMRNPYPGSGWRSLESDDRDGLRCSEARYPFPIPADPIVSVNLWDSCQGHNDVEYTTSGGATSYEMWQSGTGASYVEIYSGLYDSPMDVYVSASNSPDYVKARACNSNGCSAYSNVHSVIHGGTCQ